MVSAELSGIAQSGRRRKGSPGEFLLVWAYSARISFVAHTSAGFRAVVRMMGNSVTTRYWGKASVERGFLIFEASEGPPADAVQALERAP